MEQGFRVRATARTKGPNKTDFLEKMGVEVVDGCDLMVEGSFDKAMEGATFVHHCASPFFFAPPEGSDGTFFTKPAVEGTINVLNAAKKQSTIKRAIVTSSVASITWGNPNNHPEGKNHIWTEDDWQEDNTLEKGPYRLSKRLAEEEAHKYKEFFEVVTICPAFVLGPVLSSRCDAASVKFQKSLLDGESNSIARLTIGGVDVRDVADAHISAQKCNNLGSGNNKGLHRFILSNEKPISFLDYAKIAKSCPEFSQYSIPTEEHGEDDTGLIYSNERTRNILGIKFTPLETTIKEGLQSLIDFGIVSPPQ